MNKAVEDVLKSQCLTSASENRKKRKYTTSFTPEDWAHIRRDDAENGNGAAGYIVQISLLIVNKFIQGLPQGWPNEVLK